MGTLGFGMIAGGPLLLVLATLVFGLDADELAFFVVPVVLAALGAFLLRRQGTLPKVGAIVLAVVSFGMVFWTAFGLALPASFFDFVPGTLVLPGALLAIGGTITSIRSAKAQRSSTDGERRAVMVVLAALGLLAVTSAVLTVTGRDTVPDALADSADLTVSMKDFEFDQAGYDVPAGGTVLVENDDPFVHTFTVEALDIDVELGPYSEKLIEVPDEVGTYVLYCQPHTGDTEAPGEDDMAAGLTVS